MLLTVSNLEVCYGVISALQDVSLEVDRGEIVTLIGANGAGKTTLLRTISGLLKPARGNIHWDPDNRLDPLPGHPSGGAREGGTAAGSPAQPHAMGDAAAGSPAQTRVMDYRSAGPSAAGLHRMRPHEIVRAGISHVPEGRQVFPNLTVRENLLLGGYLRPRRQKARAPSNPRQAATTRRVPPAGQPAPGETVEYAHPTTPAPAASDPDEDVERVFGLFPVLGERLSQKAGTLSGGEQQMLAIGRALMARPKLLLLDEPSLGLAPLVVRKIFQIIREINAEGTTIFLVEQNAHMALGVAHRGYVLQTGRVIKSDRASALLEDPDVKKAYLGG
jgi:branched-chain amino acid transport system ATP-binding protein